MVRGLQLLLSSGLCRPSSFRGSLSEGLKLQEVCEPSEKWHQYVLIVYFFSEELGP